MKAGEQVKVKGGAQDGLQGVVVKPNGASTLVRFPQAVLRRNGTWSEEVWLVTRQLTVIHEAVAPTP